MELKAENMTSYKERQSTKEIPETPNLINLIRKSNYKIYDTDFDRIVRRNRQIYN